MFSDACAGADIWSVLILEPGSRPAVASIARPRGSIGSITRAGALDLEQTMHIRLFDGHIKTSEAEFSYICERIGGVVRRALGPTADVEVRLTDINGPRGGADKCCAILLACPAGRSLRVEKRAKTYYDAIDAAAITLRRALTKSLERAGLSACGGRLRPARPHR